MIKAAEGRYYTALARFNAERFTPPTDAERARHRAMTPEERIQEVTRLTRAAWARTGVPMPRIPRSQWPVRVVKLADDV